MNPFTDNYSYKKKEEDSKVQFSNMIL